LSKVVTYITSADIEKIALVTKGFKPKVPSARLILLKGGKIKMEELIKGMKEAVQKLQEVIDDEELKGYVDTLATGVEEIEKAEPTLKDVLDAIKELKEMIAKLKGYGYPYSKPVKKGEEDTNNDDETDDNDDTEEVRDEDGVPVDEVKELLSLIKDGLEANVLKSEHIDEIINQL